MSCTTPSHSLVVSYDREGAFLSRKWVRLLDGQEETDIAVLAALEALLTPCGTTLVTSRESGVAVNIPANVLSYSFAVLGTTGTASDGTTTFPVGYSETVVPHENSPVGNPAIALTVTGDATISATWTTTA